MGNYLRPLYLTISLQSRNVGCGDSPPYQDTVTTRTPETGISEASGFSGSISPALAKSLPVSASMNVSLRLERDREREGEIESA